MENINDKKTIINKMIDLINELECFLKEKYLLNCRYNYVYSDILTELFIIDAENKLLAGVVDSLNRKDDLNKVNSFIEETKKNFSIQFNNFSKLQRDAKFVYEKQDKWNEEYINELNLAYSNYVKDYHPYLKVKTSRNDVVAFQHLNRLYNDNNYESFLAMYDMCLPNIVKLDLEVVTVEELDEKYRKLALQVPHSIESLSDKSFLDKKDIFNNEMTIEAHRAELRYELNSLKQMNKEIHQEVIRLFGDDVKIAS